MDVPNPSLGLFRLTWPIFLELLLFMLMGTSDVLMLSGVSDDAVSAAGVVNQYISLCILIMNVISHGASIVVAQYLGARRNAEASRISAVAIMMNLMLGLVVSAVLLSFGRFILSRMNLEGTVLVLAHAYMRIAGGFIFLQALINVLAGLIRTYGFTRQSMFVSMGMNLLHVLCNYALIFGHFGMPEMGVTGAAVSTGISRAAALGVFAWLLYRVMDVRMVPRDFVAFPGEYIRKILKVGVPSAIEQITYHSCQTVFLYFVTFLGSAALASRQYAMAISQYFFLCSLAIGMGTAILVGRRVGARQSDEAYRRALESLKWAVVITVLVDVLIILMRQPLVSLFTDNGDIVLLTAQIILLSLVMESGRSLNRVLVNALRAAGDAQFTVYMALISMVCMSLPLGYTLVFTFQLGLPGVWLALAADEWIRGLVSWYRWKSRVWERKSLVEPLEEAVPVAVGG
ncbi:MATE family efflux transporter [Stigmatella sp. ncwal1]|uniref:MATE family efflux transporter n=1 Tax=Stigmatella ashevillensis TaxID=2995309 RepID=A0ABT5DDV7_9BACT|nr:MATE family efflux transporter [Stigmatella ashevillena]MDC0711865.1 MATE family efflux transporter [Stigmatella ashevillena]